MTRTAVSTCAPRDRMLSPHFAITTVVRKQYLPRTRPTLAFATVACCVGQDEDDEAQEPAGRSTEEGGRQAPESQAALLEMPPTKKKKAGEIDNNITIDQVCSSCAMQQITRCLCNIYKSGPLARCCLDVQSTTLCCAPYITALYPTTITLQQQILLQLFLSRAKHSLKTPACTCCMSTMTVVATSATYDIWVLQHLISPHVVRKTSKLAKHCTFSGTWPSFFGQHLYELKLIEVVEVFGANSPFLVTTRGVIFTASRMQQQYTLGSMLLKCTIALYSLPPTSLQVQKSALGSAYQQRNLDCSI